MDKQKKQSVIPIYAVGLVWLSRAISGNLSSFGQIIKTVILSVVTYGVLRIFFPDKIKQADPEKPAQQPDAPKQAQTQKTQPQPQKTQPQPQPEEKKQDEPSTGNAELDAVLKQGAASVEKIQSLNDEIPDFKLSAQIKQIEILTEKIFAYVREHPQDIGEIRQFLNYYLPTTIKLLEQYVVLQKTMEKSAFFNSGIITRSPAFDALASEAARTHNMPFFEDLQGDADNIVEGQTI